MSKIRSFIAVEVSPAVLRRAADLIERLRTDDVRATWVDPSRMHLTLKFLGDVAESDVPAICRAAGRAAATLEPFEISLADAGAFPDLRRPRTVWIGVDQGVEALCRLQAALDVWLKKIGFPIERRPFHPHLTLGRIRQGGAAASLLGDRIRQLEPCDAATAPVNHLVVFASRLAKTGPIYEVLGRAPLGAGP